VVVNPDVHVLLSTDELTSTPSLAWTKKYGKSKVVTFLMGHDNHAYSSPNFRKFLSQAIQWVK
jgi:type 1 glutamine amidotransferase